MSSKLFFTVMILAGALSFTPQSQAAEIEGGSGGYVGAHLGDGIINNNGGSNFTYGVGGGYKFSSQWSVGLDYTYNTFTVPSPLSANLSLILANLRYYIASTGLFAGVKIGSGILSYSGTGAPGSSTNMAWGPTIGYNYNFVSNWTVGVDGNLLWISNTNPGVNVIQVLANIKYWF